MRDFSSKAAVITGGASGIGLAFAERFGRAGCRILIADIEGQAIESAVSHLTGQGIEAHGHQVDVADFSAVEGLAAAAADKLGNVHLLFNNAGVSITGPTWLMAEDDWRWVWDVNVWGVVNGIRAFLPAMLAHGEGGHVINTGSLASFNGNGDHAPYCSSKAAVLGLSQSLYSEMKAMITGIGVSIVCPGMVATRIHQSWRNRPDDDRPWSDREFANKAFLAGSEEFQGRGMAPEQIAQSTFEAVQEDRFYVFSGANWRAFMEGTVARAVRGENPFVLTWGEDRRPESERGRRPWASANDLV
ncbi:SDR family NAD(P)-dependent oxidoreductase [Parafrankia sp. BMG5.11]|uniref:SDR family NAD(P)-dependent oxidoreductase n=1 Tax=Parafrankia sp. BMG5.11 TaxID=222540 RepID=UPI001038F334|nr:SDR family NAD(P)-dependent oxidoreductase [Parafrankia sp. BMG5.11]TCJ38875.1 SDR family NAD(P)-dependent oxidoreductase [Parafrankia sp. BMG5.11]